MIRDERLACGVVALLVLIAFVFGIFGGGLAGVGVMLYFRATTTSTPPPISAITATPTVAVISTSPAPLIVTADDEAVINAVGVVGPAVVTVITTLPPRRGFFGRITRPESRGSGVIIDKDGHVITNNHVVEDAESLSVILANGERREAKLIGADVFTDLAVIQVSGSDFRFAALGDSASLAPGQRVIAIGSALGDFRNTVTVGVVSGLGRSLETESDFLLEDLIQTDAAINEGNSGGPLIDIRGRVVGINTLIVGRSSGGVVAEGLGFAMAANTVRSVAEQIIRTGRVARPYLGIAYQVMTPGLASYYGLSVTTGILVTEVARGSAAEKAGLQAGDVILQISGQDINDSTPYLNVLMRHRPGDKVTLSINRTGQALNLDVVLGERQQP